MRFLLAVCLCAFLTACGYVGAPLPPALNTPIRITDLRAVQRGDQLVLAFTPSLMSTDDLLLKSLQEIELRAGPKGEGEFEVWRWAAGAEKFVVQAKGAEPIEHRIPAGSWEGKEIILAVRAIGPTGRGADWSNLLVLTVVKPLPRPASMAAKNDAKGLYLTWQGPALPAGASWRVWRSSEDASGPVLLGLARDPSWLDTEAVLGAKYSYWVQAMLPQGQQQAEGEAGEVLPVTYIDEFAPAVPAGLTAIAGLRGVELAWERNTEADLAGYQVYRALEDAPLAKLGSPVPLPAASDPTAEPGKRYRYAVSALDSAGNLSRPCEPVEIVAPQKPE
jgi:hypothetical protein